MIFLHIWSPSKYLIFWIIVYYLFGMILVYIIKGNRSIFGKEYIYKLEKADYGIIWAKLIEYFSVI